MSQERRPRPFRRDGRGNRLEEWSALDCAGGHDLWLRGTEEMVAQVKVIAPEYRDGAVPGALASRWTHVLHARSEPREDVGELLELLARVITLPALPHVAAAIALDWYKREPDDVDAPSWNNTEVGELVSRGKYNYAFRPALQAKVGRSVAGRLCRVIQRHPAFRAANVVLDVPGHDSEQLSFGSRIAATVAEDIGKPLVAATARGSFRPAAKSMEPGLRAKVIRGQFSVKRPLDGMTVLVVDDVLRSGESMREAARAAGDAGASRVYGICAVRTMRR